MIALLILTLISWSRPKNTTEKVKATQVNHPVECENWDGKIFEKIKIEIFFMNNSSKVLTTELADEHKEISTGLMCRKEITKSSGMLFEFKTEQNIGLWMIKVNFPIEILYWSYYTWLLTSIQKNVIIYWCIFDTLKQFNRESDLKLSKIKEKILNSIKSEMEEIIKFIVSNN